MRFTYFYVDRGLGHFVLSCLSGRIYIRTLLYDISDFMRQHVLSAENTPGLLCKTHF